MRRTCTSTEPPTVTSIRPFPEGRRQRLRGRRGPARRRPGGRSAPQARSGCVGSPRHRAGAAPRRPLLPPLPRGGRPASPSQIRSRRCRFTLCRSMGRAGPRRPRRRGRTRDPSLAARAAPAEPERRDWAHASGIAATEVPRASASGPWTLRMRRVWGPVGRDRVGLGRSGVGRYSRVTAGSGPAGAAGNGPGVWLQKAGRWILGCSSRSS